MYHATCQSVSQSACQPIKRDAGGANVPRHLSVMHMDMRTHLVLIEDELSVHVKDVHAHAYGHAHAPRSHRG